MINLRHYKIYKNIIDNVLRTPNSYIPQADLKRYIRAQFGYGREAPERIIKIFIEEGLLIKFTDKTLNRYVLIKRGTHKENK